MLLEFRVSEGKIIQKYELRVSQFTKQNLPDRYHEQDDGSKLYFTLEGVDIQANLEFEEH